MRMSYFIQVVPLHLPPGDPAIDRNLYIDGTSEQIEAAKQLVNEVISEVCVLCDCCHTEHVFLSLYLVLQFRELATKICWTI